MAGKNALKKVVTMLISIASPKQVFLWRYRLQRSMHTMQRSAKYNVVSLLMYVSKKIILNLQCRTEPMEDQTSIRVFELIQHGVYSKIRVCWIFKNDLQ